MNALSGNQVSGSGQPPLSVASPGARLQQARLARNIELADMAECLNLSRGVVRALEADDYRKMPGPTFVKGYLRTYAREMDLDGEDLVRAYVALTDQGKPAKVEPINAPLVSEGRKTGRNLLLALALFALIGAGAWLTMTSTPPPKEERFVAPMMDGQAGKAAEVAAVPQVQADSQSDAEIVASVGASNESLEAEEPAAVVEAQPAPATPALVAVAPEPASEPAPVAAVEVAEAEAPTAAVAPEEAIPAPPADGTGLVNLRFQGDCWVEIRDRSGKMVYSGLKRAGEEVTQRVKAPVHIKLGNGDVVNVQYNYQPVNVTTRYDNKVVRLSLGEN